jgi:hypothetical protein
LRAQVSQEKAEKTGEILRVQNVHRRQSRYTRDTTQARAKKAGYATESEKIMGGQTGYSAEGTPIGVKVPAFVPLGARAIPDEPKQEPVMAGFANYLGQVAASVSQATADVAVATEDVRQTTEDVQKGVATRADLLRVMARLDEKVEIVKKLSAKSNALSGFADTGHGMRNALLVAAVIAIAVFVVIKMKK